MRLPLALLTCLTCAAAVPSISDKTKEMRKNEGFQVFYWDEAEGKIWLEVARFGEEFLYVSSLPAGIGSNDIGLDRGQLGETRLVRWARVGPRVLLIQSNQDFRAMTDNADERRAVRDSFAEAVIWGFEVAAEQDGRVLVDATAFYLRDAHNVTRRLQEARQGTWRLEASRCALFMDRTKSFPKNTEVEATTTFTGGPAAAWLASVSPASDAVTVRQHHSFIELPEAGYEPRQFDPRGGFWPVSYYDFATPVGDPLIKRFIRRHRLVKKNPGAAISPPVKPIIYYLDRGTPEPVRKALLDGARWWKDAFLAAGFSEAFMVEMLPEGADPMDVRYNVIQWVHRSTRGWSYGSSVGDPRTGEIIKGHVTLGSLRVRQDYLIAEAFIAPYSSGAVNPAMLEMSLARLRQLSAHEVGHTLGLSHNYIASTANRASVMDYPHPYIKLGEGGLPDLSDAYATGIGEWDKVAIDWGYRQFNAAQKDDYSALNRILDEARRRGITFLTDEDARPSGSAHPEAHLWDNGRDPVEELGRVLQLRAKAIERFGENNIRPGTPLALLEDVFVPLYFSHRYQTEAAVKTIGGQRYTYALRGDGQTAVEDVSTADQLRALDAVLSTLRPEVLEVPTRIVKLIPPRPAGYEHTRELFGGRTAMTFDSSAAAESAAGMVLELLLDPARASRLAQAPESSQASLRNILRRMTTELVRRAGGRQNGGMVAEVYLRQLMRLAVNESASPGARDTALREVDGIKSWLTANQTAVLRKLMLSQIGIFEKDPKSTSLPRPPDPPPGMPIGMEASCEWR